MYNQNLNDAQLASLSILSYSRWRPRWRRRIRTCVFSQVYVRFYIVMHVFRCFKSNQIHLESFCVAVADEDQAGPHQTGARLEEDPVHGDRRRRAAPTRRESLHAEDVAAQRGRLGRPATADIQQQQIPRVTYTNYWGSVFLGTRTIFNYLMLWVRTMLIW